MTVGVETLTRAHHLRIRAVRGPVPILHGPYLPLCSRARNKSGVRMAFAVGKRVVAESESIARRPRSGVVEEVLRRDPSPRYRIRGTMATRASIRPRAALSALSHALSANARRQGNAKQPERTAWWGIRCS